MKNKKIETKTVEAYVNRQAPRGFENGVDQADLIMPRAKLIQALSPELNEGIENIKVGSIINSVTKEILPPEFIPIFMFKKFIRFNPRNKDDPNFDYKLSPGAIIWRTDNALDSMVQEQTSFGPNGEKPLATTFLNFFSYFPGSQMPIIVSFCRTSYKTGKQLLSLAKFCGGDMFSRKYRLTSVMEVNDVANYAVLKVTPIGELMPDEFKICERMWKDFSTRAKDIQLHEEDELKNSDVPF